MSMVERFGDLHSDPEHFEQRQRATGEPIGERFTLDQFHDEVVRPVFLPDVVKDPDVRMIECGHQACFALEARQAVGILRNVFGQDLDRHLATQPGIARAVDLSHSAGTERGDDDVISESGSRGQGHRRTVSHAPAHPNLVATSFTLWDHSRVFALRTTLAGFAASLCLTAMPWVAPVGGSHPVGFMRLHAPAGEVDAWYPARLQGARMRFVDLLADSARTVAFLSGAKVPEPEIAQLLSASLNASMNASPDTVPHPLVLLGQGNGGAADELALLAENLASHGYVVASTPSPTLRASLEREDQMGEFAEMQANDLAAAVIAVAKALPADTTVVGVVGYSFGARGALLLAMRSLRMRALVSLDGGIGTATGVASLRGAPSFRSNVVLPPILHFYERADSFMAPDFTLLRGLHPRSLTLRQVRHVHHAHFTTYGMATARLPGLAAAMHADSATADSVRVVLEETRKFLDRELKVR
jgi:dienelactone hydrolase